MSGTHFSCEQVAPLQLELSHVGSEPTRASGQVMRREKQFIWDWAKLIHALQDFPGWSHACHPIEFTGHVPGSHSGSMLVSAARCELAEWLPLSWPKC